MEANDLIEKLKNIDRNCIVIKRSEFSEPEMFAFLEMRKDGDVVLYSDILRVIEECEKENTERLIG